MTAAPQLIVLVIDDEAAIRKLLRVALEREGYAVHEADTAQGGLAEIAYRKPDVIILDLSLPDMDGFEALKRLREWSRTPVVILSVRQEVDEKVRALDAGADDYLTKPFHAAELFARIRAVRRHSPVEPDEPVHRAGDIVVDFAARRVTIRDEEIRLTSTEYALLRVLVRHRGRVVTQRQLLREVWGPNVDERSQYLRVYVNRLRKKLETPSGRRVIATEPGIGYRFMEE